MADFQAGVGSATLQLSVQVAGQSIQGNYSVVNWQLYLICGNGQSWNADSTGWSVSINGAGYSGGYTFDFRHETVHLIASGSTVVGHNADGTKVIGVSGYTAYTGTSAIGGPGSVSGNVGLPTIPRASTPSMSPNPCDFGQPITINTNRADGSFTHTLAWSFGTQSGTIGTGIGASATWTPPLSLLSEIPNAASGTGTLTTTTYQGGTYIGTSYVGFTLSAPSSIVPTVTSIADSEAVSSVASLIGAYVQGLSRLTIALSGAVGVYGSTIASYRIIVDNQTINAQSGTMTSPFISSGSLTITGIVTDSRGRQGTITKNITVLAYSPPKINSAVFQRSLVDGTPADEGTYLRWDLNAVASSLIVGGVEKNALSYSMSYRDRGSSDPFTPDKAVTLAGVTFNSYDESLDGTFNIEQAYEALLSISDVFGNSSQVGGTIATAHIFMHWGSKSEGLGIGKYWERGAVDVLGTMYQNDGERVASLQDALRVKTGVIDPLWVSGLPSVILDDGTGVVTDCTWGSDYTPVPGASVYLIPKGDPRNNSWVILGTLSSTASSYLNQLYPVLTGGLTTSNSGSNYYPVSFTKTPDGIVMLQGACWNSSGAVWPAGKVFFTLPVGFRPDYDLVFPMPYYGGYLSSLTVAANGDVFPNQPFSTADSRYWGFGNVAFPAAGVASWINYDDIGSGMALQNGYTPLLSTVLASRTLNFGKPRIWADNYGFVWVQGCMNTGTSRADDTLMLSVPSAYEGLNMNHCIATANFSQMALIGATGQPGGSSAPLGITWKTSPASAGWISLSSVTGYELKSAAHTWSAFPGSGGWSAYGSGFTSPGIITLPNKMVRVRGLLAGPAGTSQVGILPAGFRGTQDASHTAGNPSLRAAVNNTALIENNPSGAVWETAVFAGNNGWFSLDIQQFALGG